MKHTLRFFIGLVLLTWGISNLHATVNFLLQAETLLDHNGNPMTTSGLIVLVADTSGNGFNSNAGVYSGSLAVGSSLNDSSGVTDNLIVYKADLSAFDTAGVFQEGPGLTLSGNWNAGDPLAIYWFPLLSLSSTTLTAGTYFGMYTASTGLDGSDSWVTPNDGIAATLNFFTTDASVLNEGGSNATSTAWASYAVVPEPTIVTLLLVGAGMAGAAWRRKSS